MLRVWCGAALVLTVLFATANMALSREWEVGEMDSAWQVVFTSFQFSSELIAHVMNSNGSDPQMLLLDAMPITTPICSPGGSHLAFIAGQSIYIIRADGTELQEVYSGVSPQSARLSVSSEGKVVVFGGILDRDGRGELATLVINTETSEYVTLDGELWFNVLFFDISPDGSRIALLTGSGDIYITNRDGRVLKHILTHVLNPSPDWSPDGSIIALSSGVGNVNISLLDVDRFILVPITHSIDYRAWKIFPSWLPDGQQLLFNNYESRDGSNLYLMNADGSQQRSLTDSPMSVETACFLTARPISLIAGS